LNGRHHRAQDIYENKGRTETKTTNNSSAITPPEWLESESGQYHRPRNFYEINDRTETKTTNNSSAMTPPEWLESELVNKTDLNLLLRFFHTGRLATYHAM
jgi:hypothetical protein